MIKITQPTWIVQLIQRRGTHQLVKFGLVGLFNFAIDIGATNFLVLQLDWQPTYAGYVGTGLALFSSFILNRRWTFRVREGAIGYQASRFLLIHGTGALINAVTYTLLIHQFELWYNAAKVLSIFGSGLWNFFLTKYWVFRDMPPLVKAMAPESTK